MILIKIYGNSSLSKIINVANIKTGRTRAKTNKKLKICGTSWRKEGRTCKRPANQTTIFREAPPGLVSFATSPRNIVRTLSVSTSSWGPPILLKRSHLTKRRILRYAEAQEDGSRGRDTCLLGYEWSSVNIFTKYWIRCFDYKPQS